MSRILTRAFPLLLVALCIAGGIGMALWPLEAGDGTASPRELTLVVHDMAFYVEGNAAPNPTIHLKRGEQIALTIINEDTGMTHDFSIVEWGVRTRTLKGKGSEQIVFSVPATAESGQYVCTPHSVVMRGVLVIE